MYSMYITILKILTSSCNHGVILERTLYTNQNYYKVRELLYHVIKCISIFVLAIRCARKNTLCSLVFSHGMQCVGVAVHNWRLHFRNSNDRAISAGENFLPVEHLCRQYVIPSYTIKLFKMHKSESYTCKWVFKLKHQWDVSNQVYDMITSWEWY